MSSEIPRPARAATPTPVRLVPHVAELVSFAERITNIRATRKELLPSTLFGEPGWDMLLAIYVASMKGHRMTVTNVCDASDAPSTTALRWLDRLLELGMVKRVAHPNDLRVIYVDPEPEAKQLVERFLRQSWRTVYSAEHPRSG